MSRTMMFVTAPTKEEAYEVAKPLIPSYLKEGGKVVLEALGVSVEKVPNGSVVVICLTGTKVKVDVADESSARYIVLVAEDNEHLAKSLQDRLGPEDKVFTCEGNFGEGIKYIRYDSESDYGWILPSSFPEQNRGA